MKKRRTNRDKRVVSRMRPVRNIMEENRWAVPIVFGLIFIVVLILFGEFVFSDQMLHGSDMLSAGIFFREFYVDYVWANAAVPQWNPYIFGGLPFVDAFHGDLFYPLSVLKFFGSLHWMLGFNLVLHIYLAGLLMYWCARQFSLSRLPSLLAAVCYMFAPYLVSLISPGHDGKIFVTTLFPVAIVFLDKGFDSESWLESLFNFSVMGLSIGLIILTPHPQMSYFALWALGAFTLFRLFLLYRKKRSPLPLIRPATLAMYAVIIGLGLSAIQFYPGYFYTTNFSPRAETKKGWDWATSWSMHEEEAFSLLVPEFAGVSAGDSKTVYWGKNVFKDNSESVGVVSIFVALLGLFLSRHRYRYFLGGMALLALLYALGATTPVFNLFYYLVPKVSSLRAPSMIMFLFSFSISLLAGFGLQSLMESSPMSGKSGKKFNYLLFGFPGFLLLVALCFGAAGKGMLGIWTSLFYSEAARTTVQQGLTKMDLAYANLGQIQTGAWWAFLFVALAATFIWLYRRGVAGPGIMMAFLLIPIVNDTRFDKRFIRTVDPKPYWEPNAVSEFFTNQPGHFRVANFTKAVPQNYLPQFGISVLTGYHGNQLRWFDKLLGGPGARNQTNPNLINLSGVRYLLLPSNQGFPDGYLGEQPVKSLADFGPVKIWQNDNALPRVFLVDQYKVVNDPDSLSQLILNGPNDFRSVVYLEEEPDIELSKDTLSSDSAWIAAYHTDSVLVGLEVTRDKILVLTDNFYDSWQVTVDDQPAKLFRCYGSFRAVPVKAGSNVVKFVYSSERYRVGKLLTTTTSVYLLLIFGFFIVSSRMRRRP